MVGHHAKHRTYHHGRPHALDAVDKIFCRDFARSPSGQIQGAFEFGCLFCPQVVIKIISLVIFGKSRVRRKLHSLLDGDAINRPCNEPRVSIRRKLFSIFIVVRGHHDFFCRPGHKLIRALEVMVAVEHLVDAVDVDRLIGRI